MARIAAAVILLVLSACASTGAPEPYVQMWKAHPEYAVCGGRIK